MDDFYVVAGGILGRKQTEERAGRAGDAVHMAFQSLAGRIHMDFGSLADSHVSELRLFEIGGDPHFIERHDGEELLAGLGRSVPTTTVLFTSPVTGATILVYCRFSWACSSRARFCFTSAIAARTRARVDDTCCGPVSAILVVRVRLRQAALRLLHELLRGRLSGGGCRHRRGAGFGRGQRLIVDLLGDLPLVDQQLVAVEIVLRLYVVGLGLLPIGHGRR